MAAELRGPLLAAHRDAQGLLSRWVARRMAEVWPSLAPDRLDATVGPWVRLASEVIASGRALSALLAGSWHRADRSAALDLAELDADVTAFIGAARTVAARTGDPVPVTVVQLGRRVDVPPAPDPPPEDDHRAPAADTSALRASLVVTGPITIKKTQDVRRAQKKSTAAAQRHVRDAGRELVLDRVKEDRAAIGWARIPDDDPCAFCLMLASRGAVFKTESAAKYRHKGGKAESYHDGCECEVWPLYDESTPLPEKIRDAQDLWDESTDGLKGDDARKAFRRAVEKRSAARSVAAQQE